MRRRESTTQATAAGTNMSQRGKSRNIRFFVKVNWGRKPGRSSQAISEPPERVQTQRNESPSVAHSPLAKRQLGRAANAATKVHCPMIRQEMHRHDHRNTFRALYHMHPPPLNWSKRSKTSQSLRQSTAFNPPYLVSHGHTVDQARRQSP